MEWSFWEKDLQQQKYDLLIIGGGFSGMSTAYHVRQRHPNWRIGIVDRLPWQRMASTRNAGFACISSLSEMMEDVTHYGWEATLSLIEKRWQGLQILQKLFTPKEIELQWLPSGEIFFSSQYFPFSHYADKLAEANLKLKDIVGHDYFTLWSEADSKNQYGAEATRYVSHAMEGQLHPGKLAYAWRRICRKADIDMWEGIDIKNILPYVGGYHLESEGITFDATRVLVAANGLSKKLIPSLDVSPVINMVMVSEPLEGWNWRQNIHAEAGFVYARVVRNRLLVGGGRHILSPEEQRQLSPIGERQLHDYLLQFVSERNILPKKGVNWDMKWQGYLGVGAKKMPIVERLDDGMYVLARLSGMGVALSSYLGQEMAIRITED